MELRPRAVFTQPQLKAFRHDCLHTAGHLLYATVLDATRQLSNDKTSARVEPKHVSVRAGQPSQSMKCFPKGDILVVPECKPQRRFPDFSAACGSIGPSLAIVLQEDGVGCIPWLELQTLLQSRSRTHPWADQQAPPQSQQSGTTGCQGPEILDPAKAEWSECFTGSFDCQHGLLHGRFHHGTLLGAEALCSKRAVHPQTFSIAHRGSCRPRV